MYARKEFEKLCVGLVKGLPNDKMGADGGVDGRIVLENNKIAICSVKSGKVSVKDIRELKGLLDKNNTLGVFITLRNPTKEMIKEVSQHPPYNLQDTENTKGNIDMIPDTISKVFPKIQILTVDEILKGKRPDLPYFGGYKSGR